MLFSRDSRVVLVAHRWSFSGRPRGELLGRTVHEVFDRDSFLERRCSMLSRRGGPLSQREFEAARRKACPGVPRFCAGEELADRCAADHARYRVGPPDRRRDRDVPSTLGQRRLTRGVAHEVKNPINAIVLHLQLLRNKLAQQEPDTAAPHGHHRQRNPPPGSRGADAGRLHRPRDLHLEEIDLRCCWKTWRNSPLPTPSSMASPSTSTCLNHPCPSRSTSI